MKATPKQIGYLRGLLKQHGQEVSKEELEALTKDQASAMIKSIVPARSETPSSRMINKILSMAHTIGWETTGGKVDIERINSWCTHKGQYKKPLDKHTAKELPHLVSQFQLGPFKYAMSKR